MADAHVLVSVPANRLVVDEVARSGRCCAAGECARPLPSAMGRQLPVPDGASDYERLAISVANFAVGLLRNGRFPIHHPLLARDVAWFGDSTLTGYRAAAADLLALLAEFPECRKALADLGLEKFFQEVG